MEKVKATIELSIEELWELMVYVGNAEDLIDEYGLRETEVENIINEAFHMDNNTDPNFPNTAIKVLNQVWAAYNDR